MSRNGTSAQFLPTVDSWIRHLATLPEAADSESKSADSESRIEKDQKVHLSNSLKQDEASTAENDDANHKTSFSLLDETQIQQWQQLRTRLFEESHDARSISIAHQDLQDFTLSIIQQARHQQRSSSSLLKQQSHVLEQVFQMLDELDQDYSRYYNTPPPTTNSTSSTTYSSPSAAEQQEDEQEVYAEEDSAGHNEDDEYEDEIASDSAVTRLPPMDSEILGQALLLWKDVMLHRMRTHEKLPQEPTHNNMTNSSDLSSTSESTVPELENSEANQQQQQHHSTENLFNNPNTTFESWVTTDAFLAASNDTAPTYSQLIFRQNFAPRQIEDILWQHALHPNTMQRKIHEYTTPIRTSDENNPQDFFVFKPIPQYYAVITHVLARTPPEPHIQVDAWVKWLEELFATDEEKQRQEENLQHAINNRSNETSEDGGIPVKDFPAMLPSLIYLEQLVAHRNMGNAYQCEYRIKRLLGNRERARDNKERNLVALALEAWAKLCSKQHRIAEGDHPLSKAKDFFEWMKTTAIRRKQKIPIPAFHALMKAHIKTSHDHAIDDCEELFRQIRIRYKNPGPGVDSYNLLLKAYSSAKMRLPQHFEHVEEIYQEMKKVHTVKPDQTTFQCLFDMYAKVKVKPSFKKNNDDTATLEPIQRMEVLFMEMEKSSIQPTAAMYNRFLEAYAKTTTRQNSKTVVRRMQEIIDEMQTHDMFAPDIYCWNELMTAYAKSNEPEKVEEIYQMLLENFQKGHRAWEPTFHIHVTRLQAWSRAGKPTETQLALKEMTDCGFLNKLNDEASQHYSSRPRGVVTHVDPSSSGRTVEHRPSAIYFTALLSAWLRSGDSDAPEKAWKGLRQMQEFDRAGRFRCRPNPISYATVISCFHRYKHPQAGEKAMQLLQEAKDQAAHYCADKSLIPHFNLYVQTLCAQTVNCDATDEDAVWNILEELRRRKGKSFWLANRGELSQWSFVKRDLTASSFASKDKMLEMVKRLETRTLGHVGRSPPTKQGRKGEGRKGQQPRPTKEATDTEE